MVFFRKKRLYEKKKRKNSYRILREWHWQKKNGHPGYPISFDK
jgi:hypothetical protein